MKKLSILISVFCILIFFNYSIYRYEKIIQTGETVYLKIKPTDPRSILQGDYMKLRYEITDGISLETQEKKGSIVIKTDSTGIAVFVRLYKGEALGKNEKLIPFRKVFSSITLKPDSFMFQEGHARFYNSAEYAIFKFIDASEFVLVGLANKNLHPINPIG